MPLLPRPRAFPKVLALISQPDTSLQGESLRAIGNRIAFELVDQNQNDRVALSCYQLFADMLSPALTVFSGGLQSLFEDINDPISAKTTYAGVKSTNGQLVDSMCKWVEEWISPEAAGCYVASQIDQFLYGPTKVIVPDVTSWSWLHPLARGIEDLLVVELVAPDTHEMLWNTQRATTLAHLPSTSYVICPLGEDEDAFTTFSKQLNFQKVAK